MAKMMELPSFNDTRGSLTVLDDIKKLLPFTVNRIFYIYNVDNSSRGGHRHHTTVQAGISIKGSCIVSNNNGKVKQDFLLDSPSKCLILDPCDWHQMHHFSSDAILLVFASHSFNLEDYIFEPYPEI